MELNILDIQIGTEFTIIRIESDIDSKHRLNSMGIHQNDNFIKKAGNGSGPVIIQNQTGNATQIALGRDLAKTLIVKTE